MKPDQEHARFVLLIAQLLRQGLDQDIAPLRHGAAKRLESHIYARTRKPLSPRSLQNFVKIALAPEPEQARLPSLTSLNILARAVIPEKERAGIEFEQSYEHWLRSHSSPAADPASHPGADSAAAPPPQAISPETRAALAGMAVGFAAVVVIVMLRHFSGYPLMDVYVFYGLIPGLLVCYLTLGALTGWLTIYWSKLPEERWKSGSTQLATALVPALLAMLAQQLAARDAWAAPGAVNGGGGPLGEPSFETLAMGFACAAGLRVTIGLLRKGIPADTSQRLMQGISGALYPCAAYAGVFLLYRLLLMLGWISHRDYVLSRAVFTYDFSHPQRILLVVPSYLVYYWILTRLLTMEAAARTLPGFGQAYLSQEEQPSPVAPDRNIEFRVSWRVLLFFLAAISLAIIGFFSMPSPESVKDVPFKEDFINVSDSALAANGWMLQDPDSAHWKLRDTNPGFLTLYTVKGDNWVGGRAQPYLKNRLTRRCHFGASYKIEFEIRDFFPDQNFQQCGILLMEDSSLSSQLVRVNLGHGRVVEDNYGFYNLQVLFFEAGEHQRPTEHPVNFFQSSLDEYDYYIRKFNYVAIRLEVEGGMLRVHTLTGTEPGWSFQKKLSDVPMDFQPRYLAIYASGSQFSNPYADTIPVKFERISFKIL